jgi:hypothetical protein
MSGIFLSYRRDDSSGWAGRLYEHLVREWGPGQVFMDIDAIAPGEDFREAITHTMHACDVVMVVIGPSWVDALDERGNRRLDDEADNHRAEVVAAMAADVRVVPVLVGGAAMPKESELPEPLKDLAYRNAAVLDDRRFASDVHALQHALKQFAENVESERSADQEPTEAVASAPGSRADGDATSASDEPLGEGGTIPAAPAGPPAGVRRGAGPGVLRWRWLVLAALVVVVGVVTIVLLQGDSSTSSGGVTLFEDQATYRSEHGIELSGLRAIGQDDPPTVGDRIMIEFSLENVGTDALTFEETFVAARTPDDGDRDFGHENEGRVFDPGSVVEIRHSINVDAAGTWRFWPCYILTTGEFCPDEWEAFPVGVE